MTSRDQEAGFTVIEMLVAMLVMIVITVPLVSAFVLSVKTTGRGAQDAANSADTQLTSLYFETDVASAETVATTGGCVPADAQLHLQLQWQDGTEMVVVGYSTVSNTEALTEAAVSRLRRHTCSSPGGPVVATQTLGRALKAPPAFLCDGAACPATNGKPRVLKMTVTEAARRAAEADYVFVMNAIRKVMP